MQKTLDWLDNGTPVSTRFGDPYFSVADGVAEARHVFLAGNRLPERFAPGFAIAELGFGTGLSFLVAWAAWLTAGHRTPLHFTSFEAWPLSGADMRRALGHWPELAPLADAFLSAWHPDGGVMQLSGARLEVVPGDARETLRGWTGAADAWFLDGFSPARNPELWSPELLVQVARHTRPGGTFATYSAAGHVRRALATAGFAVRRLPGFAGKRHMSAGSLSAL
ncbi:tRNA (5-methylaminomethyl-2-thiouridine)(34)-methyltransferase MnmD [Paroceanicella profunda]|uniref:tRNA (5-methylaminomethyl-2-thiouridine)(34)-methyltransferase MnmD n=1 Tax=Paroceanicella profunda TaxID=2579971 RepID=A0A5B8FTR3_9RHOB|nr:tRNA (5-methylaminomethyl-2-thiouridine)(34)-methyltransferase MnmD [Paroceanicella profunda]QDL90460.1 tRNA (5-methylaminomethyl-2-thiouridine)(34)-methyltransferase MnmD [Paroceanicella profunda]